MRVSWLFIVLLIGGIPIIYIAGLLGFSLQLFIVYNVVLFLMLGIDIYMTPKKHQIHIQRQFAEKLSLGVENTIIIRIQNKSIQTLRISLEEFLPQEFMVLQKTHHLEVFKQNENCILSYVVPTIRGEFELGKIDVHYSGIWKLCNRKYSYSLLQRCKVYSNILGFSKWGSQIGRGNYLLEGAKGFPKYTARSEFEGIREYVRGDDVRKINFMASAKLNQWMVNTFEDEKNQNVLLLFDSGRMMQNKIQHIKKLDHIMNSAIVLADVAIRKGDFVGMVSFDSKVQTILKPRKGHLQFKKLIDKLYAIDDSSEKANYFEVFPKVGSLIKQRSLICIFTELEDSENALLMVKLCRTYLAKHLPLIISLQDPRLHSITNSKLERVDQYFLKGAAGILLQEREKIHRVFKTAGISYIDVQPQILTNEIINRYLEMKLRLEI